MVNRVTRVSLRYPLSVFIENFILSKKDRGTRTTPGICPPRLPLQTRYRPLNPGNYPPRSTVTWRVSNFLLHGHPQAVALHDPP